MSGEVPIPAAAQDTPVALLRPALRIGELSRRVGVSPGTLRAWERRYSLFDPTRTEAGYRLYSAEDEARVNELKRLQAEGVATAEAARLAREVPHLAMQAGFGAEPAEHAAPSQAGARVAGRDVPSDRDAGASALASLRGPAPSRRVGELAKVVIEFDELAAHAAIDRAIDDMALPALIDELILPTLRLIGARWAQGEISTAQEHFASNLFRGRLLDLGRGWGAGDGPLAMLACPSGERHDLGLISFGLLLHEQGWRIVFFGQDTPAFTIEETAALLSPDAIVISGVDPRKMRAIADDLATIADRFPTYLGGAAASRRLADRVGASILEGEPSYACVTLAQTLSVTAA